MPPPTIPTISKSRIPPIPLFFSFSGSGVDVGVNNFLVHSVRSFLQREQLGSIFPSSQRLIQLHLCGVSCCLGLSSSIKASKSSSSTRLRKYTFCLSPARSITR